MESQVSRARERSEGEIEVSLSYVFHVLFRHWKRIVGFVVGIGIVSALIFKFVVPKTYKAEALILPPSVEGVGELGSLSRLLPGLSAATTPTAIVIGLINSRTVRAAVVETLKLDSIWQTRTFLDAVKKLGKAVEAYEDEDYGTIHITCAQRDPELAALIVNTYIHVMETLNDSLKISVNKPFLKVVDWAIPPEKKWKPKPVLYSIIIMFFALIFVVGWVFYREMREPAIRDLYDFVKLTERSGITFYELTSKSLSDFVRQTTLEIAADPSPMGWITLLGLHVDDFLDTVLSFFMDQFKKAGIPVRPCFLDPDRLDEACLRALKEQPSEPTPFYILVSQDPLNNLRVSAYIRGANRVVILVKAHVTPLAEVQALVRLARAEEGKPIDVGLWSGE